jgi:hypothetical protein
MFVHLGSPVGFAPSEKFAAQASRLLVDVIIVNTVAKFQGNDDRRFICSRCAPENWQVAAITRRARRV